MIRRWLFSNGWIKVLAAALTAMLFFYVRSEREVTATVTPPLVLRVPEGLINVSPTPDRLEVGVSGPWSAVAAVAREGVPPVEVDLTSFPEGVITFHLDKDMVRLPQGVDVTSIEPTVLTLDLEPTAVREVGVEPTVQGEPAFGYRLGEPRVEPARVQLAGARGELLALDEVGTEMVDVTGATATVQRQVRVAIPAPHVSRTGREPLTVTVPVVEERTERLLENLPVLLPDGAQAHVRPDTVDLRVEGPTRIVAPLTAAGVRVTVSPEAVPAPGDTGEAPVQVNLPQGVRLVGEPPVVSVEHLP